MNSLTVANKAQLGKVNESFYVQFLLKYRLVVRDKQIFMLIFMHTCPMG